MSRTHTMIDRRETGKMQRLWSNTYYNTHLVFQDHLLLNHWYDNLQTVISNSGLSRPRPGTFCDDGIGEQERKTETQGGDVPEDAELHDQNEAHAKDDDDFELGSEDRVVQTGNSDYNLLITLCLSSVSGGFV